MKRFVIGILAHVDAGKTTMSEAILYETGKLKKMGRVDNRDAFLDTFALERARGITIFSKQAVFPLGDASVTLLDTPGPVSYTHLAGFCSGACFSFSPPSGLFSNSNSSFSIFHKIRPHLL